jgi:hypothetical protein
VFCIYTSLAPLDFFKLFSELFLGIPHSLNIYEAWLRLSYKYTTRAVGPKRPLLQGDPRGMASPTSVQPWSRSNVLVSTSYAVAPPCFFAGIFRVMISHPAIAYKVL